MIAGDLRERIVLLQRQIREDETGNMVQSWREEGRLWAAIKPLSIKNVGNNEGWFGEGENVQRYEVTIRPRHLKAKRIRWREGVYKMVTTPKIAPFQQWMTFIIEEKNDE